MTPSLAKPLFFGKLLNLLGRSQQQKMKNLFFVFIKRKENRIQSVLRWGESGKGILQVSVISSFSGHCRNIFGQRWLSRAPARKKLADMPIIFMSI